VKLIEDDKTETPGIRNNAAVEAAVNQAKAKKDRMGHPAIDKPNPLAPAKVTEPATIGDSRPRLEWKIIPACTEEQLNELTNSGWSLYSVQFVAVNSFDEGKTTQGVVLSALLHRMNLFCTDDQKAGEITRRLIHHLRQ
jgi:hypothetical protein